MNPNGSLLDPEYLMVLAAATQLNILDLAVNILNDVPPSGVEELRRQNSAKIQGFTLKCLKNAQMNGQASEPKSFALIVEPASEEFRILDSLVKGKIQIVSTDPRDRRTSGCIQMALAKSFVFHVISSAVFALQLLAACDVLRPFLKTGGSGLASAVEWTRCLSHRLKARVKPYLTLGRVNSCAGDCRCNHTP